MKKIISLILTLCLVLGTAAVAFAAPLSGPMLAAPAELQADIPVSLPDGDIDGLSAVLKLDCDNCRLNRPFRSEASAFVSAADENGLIPGTVLAEEGLRVPLTAGAELCFPQTLSFAVDGRYAFTVQLQGEERDGLLFDSAPQPLTVNVTAGPDGTLSAACAGTLPTLLVSRSAPQAQTANLSRGSGSGSGASQSGFAPNVLYFSDGTTYDITGMSEDEIADYSMRIFLEKTEALFGCLHSWSPVYGTPIHHDAVTEEHWVVDVPAETEEQWEIDSLEVTEDRWVVDSPAVTEDRWVVDSPAVTEQRWIVDAPAYVTEDGTEVPESGHYETVVVSPEVGHTETVVVSPEVGHTETVVIAPETGHYATLIVSPEVGHTETVVITPAWDEATISGYVCDKCGMQRSACSSCSGRSCG